MFFGDKDYKKYELSTSGSIESQFQTWEQMQWDGAVVRGKIPLIGKTWFATNWDSCNEVLRDQDRFCRDPRNAGKKNLPGVGWWMPRRFLTAANNMLAFDRDDHRRLRSLVDQAFLRSTVEDMRGKIETIADQMLDKFESKVAASGSGTSNFVSSFAREFPLVVIMEILGLPDEDRPKFKKWFSAMSNVKSAFDIFRMIPGLKKVLKYLDAQFVAVRSNPRPGLMNDLVQIQLDGDRLTHSELKSMVFLLLVAGHETTVHLISNAVAVLKQHPEQLALLESDWDYAPSAVDEVLRYASPVQMTKPRYVTRDMEFYGRQLAKGDLITSILAAANVDPGKFDSPHTFDILRSPNPQMGFGAGVHICLGLKLAKAETEIALRRLIVRYPELEVIHPIVWGKRLGMRTVDRLDLKL